MENTKKRYSVTVAGVPLNIITDESEEFLKKTADELSTNIKAITSHSFCVAKMDAAILCALDAMGEADKAAAKIRELESELDVLRFDLENLRIELEAAREKSASDANEKRKNIESFLDRRVNG